MSGPLPLGTRYTFTSDSVLLSNARTLSDLLAHIPGVFVARGGWYGEPEIVLYGGRGPASLEVYWDGVPMLPLGRDSVYLDPARIPLGPIERADVIVLPASLRVYLVTAQHRSTTPRTQIGIVTGQQDIADYRAGYATRTRSGFGISMLADWASIGLGSPGHTSPPFATSDIWLKADYVPEGGRVGASFQVSSSSWHRSLAPDGRVDGWRQDRRDRQLRLFVAQRDDGLGWRFTTTVGTSGISHDTLVPKRTISVASVEAIQAWPNATVAAVARLGAAGTPQQFEGRAGWMPIHPLTLAATIRQTVYSNHRAGVRAFATAGLTLPLGVSARAEVAWQHDVQAPFVTTDQVQQTLDVAGWVRVENRLLTLEVGRGRRDPFAPLGFAGGIKTVDSLNLARAGIRAGRVVFRPGRGGRRFRAAPPRARVGNLLLEILARLQERDLRPARRGGDGVLEPVGAGRARQHRRAAGDDRIELRRHGPRDAARRGHALLEHPEHQHHALELRRGAGVSQGGAAVWRPVVLQ